MGLFTNKRPSDPIADRSRALEDEIAALEAEIKELGNRLGEAPLPPRLRSTALPGQMPTGALHRIAEPVFEEVETDRVTVDAEGETTPSHYNELGVRKFDLVAAWHRLQKHVYGPSANNPKLVNYLAAGSIQGLRPLRYEKRVARNRVIALTIIFLCVILGILAILQKH
jgi:hypothetical protein